MTTLFWLVVSCTPSLAPVQSELHIQPPPTCNHGNISCSAVKARLVIDSGKYSRIFRLVINMINKDREGKYMADFIVSVCIQHWWWMERSRGRKERNQLKMTPEEVKITGGEKVEIRVADTLIDSLTKTNEHRFEDVLMWNKLYNIRRKFQHLKLHETVCGVLTNV